MVYASKIDAKPNEMGKRCVVNDAPGEEERRSERALPRAVRRDLAKSATTYA